MIHQILLTTAVTGVFLFITVAVINALTEDSPTSKRQEMFINLLGSLICLCGLSTYALSIIAIWSNHA